MASTSETGHAKNTAHFQTLITVCTGYGPSYNPARAGLQLPALAALHTGAQDSITAVNAAKANLTNVINIRQTLFDPLKKRCTRVVNALAAAGASQKLVEDARTINRKMQGARSGKINPDKEKTISVSQQSYDSLTANFAALIELLSTQSAYTPNETELQIPTLQANLESLITANNHVTQAYASYVSALIARNNTLYTPGSGIVDTALAIKKYIKSVFGTTSPEYKQISNIRFTKPRTQ
ncbi:MAG: hypothetical protein KDD04_00790 [Sinomicrobium sp.]|nr:hypothetical protein [Sinomicrobium sp.]